MIITFREKTLGEIDTQLKRISDTVKKDTLYVLKNLKKKKHRISYSAIVGFFLDEATAEKRPIKKYSKLRAVERILKKYDELTGGDIDKKIEEIKNKVTKYELFTMTGTLIAVRKG